MPKKGVVISLAAKCQLLFGLAVLVIIAGALAVPWQRMEQLAGREPVHYARVAAADALRYMHVSGERPAPAIPLHPVRYPAHGWKHMPTLGVRYGAVKIVALSKRGVAPASHDAVTRDALRLFLHRPAAMEFGRVETRPDKRRIYRYAAAVRASVSCLRCHGQWEPFFAPRQAQTPKGPAAFLPMPPPGKASPPAGSGAKAPGGAEGAGAGTGAPAPPVAAAHPGAPPPVPAAATAMPGDGPLVAILRVNVPVQINSDQLLLNRIVIVIAGMLGLTLAVVVFYLITNRLILQPVRVLRNTAEKVRKGDLNIRSAISTGDEFEQLSEAFNSMLITLKASQDQLESTNRSLDTRVGELAQMNVDLYEANRMKSEFLTNVSHELRTPLNAIIGFAELLYSNGQVRHDARLARYVENIQTSARQLLDLINDLLDLAKIEAGKIVLRLDRINVGDVCDALLNFMKPLAQKKSVTLTLQVQPDLPLVMTDPGRFQQILYNFLSNGVKFTPAEGTIHVQARREDDQHLRISVSDTGPGIAPENQKAIFEKFRQVDGSVTRQHSGTGLGLAISRDLAGMLGGTIELSSRPGKGATFSLVVPIAGPAPRPAEGEGPRRQISSDTAADAAAPPLHSVNNPPEGGR